jgi:hypothetical protein
LLRQFWYREDGKPRRGFRFEKTPVLDDIRVLDMYQAAIRHDLELHERTGNWVQEFFRHQDALQFVSAQFGDMQRIRELLTRRRGKPA